MQRSTFAGLSLVMAVAFSAGMASAQLPMGFPAQVNKGSWTDQAGVAHPWKVGLATNAGAPIWDSDLADMATPLARKGVLMHYSFAQCFGGGMVQDVTAIGMPNPGRAIRVSATSAAKWNQAAYYRESPYVIPVGGMLPVPNNHRLDWGDHYITSAGGATTAITTSGAAWNNDFFATGAARAVAGPDEASKLETAQYRESAAGVGAAFKHNNGGQKVAILYSGEPGGYVPIPPGGNAWAPGAAEARAGDLTIDDQQIVSMWNKLRADGYAAANIHVLFGGGAMPAGAPMEMMGRVSAATLMNLQGAFTAVAGLDQGDQLFFFSNDHGTARNAAMPAGFYLRVPKTPQGDIWNPQSPSPGAPQGLERYVPDPNDPFLGWATSPYYVPAPGAIALVGIGGVLIARRRR